jgi:murein DD-endopeptidase MepM/ murein hydrolase activator NlpD
MYPFPANVDRSDHLTVASHARHRRRRRSTLPVPALAGSAAVAVAVAGSLTLPAATASGNGGGVDALALDAPQRPAVSSTGSSDPFGEITQTADAVGAVTKAASTSAHRTVRAAEIERERRAAERRAAREAAERARLAAMWVAPLSGYRVSATYGQAGWMWSKGYHTGLDLTAPYGSTVSAVHSGTVTFAGWDGAYGNKIEITHEDGTTSWYAHMASLAVGLGPVTTGQTIGYVGCTGNCFGPHLHLEAHTAGGGELDPYAWLAGKGRNL